MLFIIIRKILISYLINAIHHYKKNSYLLPKGRPNKNKNKKEHCLRIETSRLNH